MPNGSVNPKEVARSFRYLLLGVLAVIVLNVVVFVLPRNNAVLAWGFLGISFIVQIFLVMLVVLTTRALRWPIVGIVVCAILVFLPLVNLIVLIVINSKCVKVLKNAGYTVGLVGAKPE